MLSEDYIFLHGECVDEHSKPVFIPKGRGEKAFLVLRVFFLFYNRALVNMYLF